MCASKLGVRESRLGMSRKCDYVYLEMPELSLIAQAFARLRRRRRRRVVHGRDVGSELVVWCLSLLLAGVRDSLVPPPTTELDSFLANHLEDIGALLGHTKGDAVSRLTVSLFSVSNIDYAVTETTLNRMRYYYSSLFFSPDTLPRRSLSPQTTPHLQLHTNHRLIEC